MTLGEKLRQARRKSGLSQEQLAERMSVSRSAVAKWETDKGLPDVGNLKMLARLLNVSVDHLLDEAEDAPPSVIREPYSLADFGYGCEKLKKDRAVRKRFPNTAIYPLYGRQQSPGMNPAASSLPDCRAGACGSGKTGGRAFYLVEREGRRFFVTVTDTFLESRPLELPIAGNSFFLDGWHFIISNYEVGL